jgi:hypothetical protein
VSFKDILLSKLSTVCAFAICFSVIFGAATWLKPVPQETLRSGSAAVVITTLTAEPRFEVTTPNPAWLVADMIAVSQQMGMTSTAPATSDQVAEPAQSHQQQASFVGVWAPDASSCSLQNFRDGLLPTVINVEGASAGDTFCSFKNQQQIQTGWRIDALCSNKQEQWSTRVHLSMSGDRLIWRSKRGSQAYTRCTNDLRIAQVH